MPSKLVKAANGKIYFTWLEGRRSRRKSTRVEDRVDALRTMAEWLMSPEPLKGIEEPGLVAVAEFLQKIRYFTPAKRPVSKPVRLPKEKLAPTIADLYAIYMRDHVVPNCADTINAKKQWRRLQGFFGDLRPAEATHEAANRFIALRTKAGVKSSTIRRELVSLTSMLNWCADPRRKLIDKADVHAFTLPAEGAPRDRWLTTAEISKLLETARLRREQHLYGTNADPTRLSNAERFLWIGLQTAARERAIIDLTWDRVDFETGMIDFNVPGRKVTKKRRVAVPMSSALRSVLQEAYQQRRGPHVLDARASMFLQVKAVAKAAGIAGVSPHVLRHTAATHMARRGVPLFHIAGVLGNTVGMVERVYAKHCPAALAAAVEKIGAPILPGDARVSRTRPPSSEPERAQASRPGRPVRPPSRFRPPRPRSASQRQRP